MTRVAMALFAAILLAGPTAASAQAKSTASRPPPSSYAPQPHSGPHVYGSPIEPPIVGQTQRRRPHASAPQSKPSAPHAARAQAPKTRRPGPAPAPA